MAKNSFTYTLASGPTTSHASRFTQKYLTTYLSTYTAYTLSMPTTDLQYTNNKYTGRRSGVATVPWPPCRVETDDSVAPADTYKTNYIIIKEKKHHSPFTTSNHPHIHISNLTNNGQGRESTLPNA